MMTVGANSSGGKLLAKGLKNSIQIRLKNIGGGNQFGTAPFHGLIPDLPS